MHLAAAGATRAAEKAALIDAHDLAENERGRGRRIYGPACREARAAFHNRGKKKLEYQAKRQTRVGDWNTEGADRGCDFTRLR